MVSWGFNCSDWMQSIKGYTIAFELLFLKKEIRFYLKTFLFLFFIRALLLSLCQMKGCDEMRAEIREEKAKQGR